MQGAQAEVAEAVVGAVGERGRPARPGGRRAARTNSAVRSAIRPSRWPTATDAEKDVDALAGGLVGDGRGQQPGGEPGVRGVLGDQTRRPPRWPARAAPPRRPRRCRPRSAAAATRPGSASGRSAVRSVRVRSSAVPGPSVSSPASRRGRLKPDRLARWSRGALPRSARGLREGGAGSTRAAAARASRPPAHPRGPDVSAPGPVGRARCRQVLGLHVRECAPITPLRDSSGFAPDSPAATASMSIHLGVAGALPTCCVAGLATSGS